MNITELYSLYDEITERNQAMIAESEKKIEKLNEQCGIYKKEYAAGDTECKKAAVQHIAEARAEIEALEYSVENANSEMKENAEFLEAFGEMYKDYDEQKIKRKNKSEEIHKMIDEKVREIKKMEDELGNLNTIEESYAARIVVLMKRMGVFSFAGREMGAFDYLHAPYLNGIREMIKELEI